MKNLVNKLVRSGINLDECYAIIAAIHVAAEAWTEEHTKRYGVMTCLSIKELIEGE